MKMTFIYIDMEDRNGNIRFLVQAEMPLNFLSLGDIFRLRLPVWSPTYSEIHSMILNSAAASKKRWTMAFAPSPTSTINSESNFSLIDSISNITTLDMSVENNDNNQPAPNEEEFPSRPGSVLENEGSLNSSMITIIVSPPSFSSTLFFLHAFFSTGQRHPISTRFSLPRKRIGDIESYYYLVRVRLNPFEWD